MTVSMRNEPLTKALLCDRRSGACGSEISNSWPGLKLGAQTSNNLRTAPLVSEGGVSPPPLQFIHSGLKNFQAGSLHGRIANPTLLFAANVTATRSSQPLARATHRSQSKSSYLFLYGKVFAAKQLTAKAENQDSATSLSVLRSLPLSSPIPQLSSLFQYSQWLLKDLQLNVLRRAIIQLQGLKLWLLELMES
jgi:hypothetical protein